MARSVEQINKQLVDTLVVNFATIGITINPTLWSKRDLLRKILYTVSICIAFFEQLLDEHKKQSEETADRTPAASSKWIQNKMFKFQYSDTNPQVVALIDTVPQYPVVDATLAIITACSVTSNVSNETLIKVAKDFPFVALSAPQKSAAQEYIDIIGVEGINYVVISLESDKIFIEADCYYKGQYASVISATTIAAIEKWMLENSSINLDGRAEMSDLEVAMKAVPGMTDVVLKNVRGRADTDSFGAGIDLILNTQILQRRWVTVAGYIGQETDTGHTFADSLNFIPE